MSIAALSAIKPFPRPTAFQAKILVAAISTAFADWLLFGYRPGISIALFALVLAIGIALCYAPSRSLASNLKATILLLFSLIPIVEELNPLSAAIGAIGLAVYSLLMSGTFKSLNDINWKPVLRLFVTGPFRLPYDWARERRKSPAKRLLKVGKIELRSWLIPVSFSLIFIYLFMSANPVIEQFISWLLSFSFDWDQFIKFTRRAGFWVLLLAVSWAFLQPYRKYLPDLFVSQKKADNAPAERKSSEFFGINSILRSLVLFNIIFAGHTISDAIYLWGGADLPEGLTYAAYAYRGTYALMAAAVIAALFVLVAMRKDSEGAKSPLVRSLVYLWIGQSVMMIVSVLYRLDLYLDVYSLTYTRIAGFIWTVLVGAGLVLIIVQIVRHKSFMWLVRANIIAVFAVAYGASLTNFDHIIAKYNIEHSREISGTGRYLDWKYLKRLGSGTLPSLLNNYYELLENNPATRKTSNFYHWVNWRVNSQQELDNWRGWGYRQARLTDYLRNYRKVLQEDIAP